MSLTWIVAKCSRDACYIVSLACQSCKKKLNGVYCCPDCKEFQEAHPTIDAADPDAEQKVMDRKQAERRFVCLCQTERTKYDTVEEYYRELKQKQSQG